MSQEFRYFESSTPWKTLERTDWRAMTGFWTEQQLRLAGAGNVLWDCINVLTPNTIREVKSRGGIQAIAVSHPHFYSGMAAWAEAFDAPVFIHARDKEWVTEPCSRISFWEGACHLLYHHANQTYRACKLAPRIVPKSS